MMTVLYSSSELGVRPSLLHNVFLKTVKRSLWNASLKHSNCLQVSCPWMTTCCSSVCIAAAVKACVFRMTMLSSVPGRSIMFLQGNFLGHRVSLYQQTSTSIEDKPSCKSTLQTNLTVLYSTCHHVI